MIGSSLTSLALFRGALGTLKSIIDIMNEELTFNELIILVFDIFILIPLFEIEHLFAVYTLNNILIKQI